MENYAKTAFLGKHLLAGLLFIGVTLTLSVQAGEKPAEDPEQKTSLASIRQAHEYVAHQLQERDKKSEQEAKEREDKSEVDQEAAYYLIGNPQEPTTTSKDVRPETNKHGLPDVLVGLVGQYLRSDTCVLKHRLQLPAEDSALAIAFSPDGTQFASGSQVGLVKLWDTSTGECRDALPGHTRAVASIAFSPDGKLLVSGSYDHTIKLWDVQTKTCVETLTGHCATFPSVAFSPDGIYFASGSSDDLTIKLYNAHTRALIGTLSGTNEALAFSSDSKRLAAGSYDGTIQLWNIQTKTCIATLTEHTRRIGSIAFSPDGTYLASGSFDGTIKLWNMHTKTCIATLASNALPIYSVAFSPEGRQLASGGYGSVKVWDVSTQTYIEPSPEYTGWVMSVAFSPDGRWFASGSMQGTINIWKYPQPPLLDLTKQSQKAREADLKFQGVRRVLDAAPEQVDAIIKQEQVKKSCAQASLNLLCTPSAWREEPTPQTAPIMTAVRSTLLRKKAHLPEQCLTGMKHEARMQRLFPVVRNRFASE